MRLNIDVQLNVQKHNLTHHLPIMGVNLVVLDIQSSSIRINIRSYPLSVQGKTTNQSHPANVNENLMLDMYFCLTASELQIVSMHSFIYISPTM